MAKESCNFITFIIIFCSFLILLEHQSNEKGFMVLFFWSLYLQRLPLYCNVIKATVSPPLSMQSVKQW